MNRPRPAYIEDKIALERARREARRTHAQPCDCGYCITRERVEELLQARVAEERAKAGEVPF